MEEEKGFVIRDRRFSTEDETAESKAAEDKEAPQAEPEPGERQEAPGEEAAGPEPEQASQEEEFAGDDYSQSVLPEVNFATFVVSLSSSVLVHLGEIEDPQTGRTETSLPLARHSIDILALLQEKTKGNLTVQEEQLLNNILYDLRMRYVRKKS